MFTNVLKLRNTKKICEIVVSFDFAKDLAVILDGIRVSLENQEILVPGFFLDQDLRNSIF